MIESDKKNVNGIAHKITPRTIPGLLSSNNKDAIDWGWQSLVAYGCHNIVVIADVYNLQILQTLEKHKSHVTKVKWCRENYYHDLHKPYALRLASADASGNIVIWDVNLSLHTCTLSDGNRPVLAMEWQHNQDSCQDLLLVLHHPNTLILWNAVAGTKIWKKVYTEQLISYAVDPFDAANMAFLANDCILFVNDFSLHKMPASNGRKFFVSSSIRSASAKNPSSNDKDRNLDDLMSVLGGKSFRNHLSRILVGVDVKPKNEDKMSLNECIQLTFHSACRNHLLLLYPREILIVDLEILQTVGIIALEKNISKFSHMVSCSQRDVLYCLHENGSVSVRIRKKFTNDQYINENSQVAADSVSLSSADNYPEVSYELRCQSDSLRITKNSRVMGFVLCPVSEKRVVLSLNDGRILLLELQVLPSSKSSSMMSPLQSPNPGSVYSFSFDEPDKQIQSLQSRNDRQNSRNRLTDEIAPCLYPCVNSNAIPVSFKLLLTGYIPTVASPPLVIKMCPPLTTKNIKVYRPLLAVGNNSGTVQIINLSSGIIEKEFSVHAGPVRGIEWCGLTSLLSFSYPMTTPHNNKVHNEIVWTDCCTGRMKHLRSEKLEESSIDMIKVSCLKQYFIITFKEQAFELWDLKSMSVLRTMSRKFPNVTALEWSPVHNMSSIKKRAARLDSNSDKDYAKENSEIVKNIPEVLGQEQGDVFLKEQFVFTDGEGQLYHFSVEGNIIKDGTKLPPDGNMKSVTSIAWKGDQIVLGDIDGNLNLWDLSGKVSRSVPTHRGWIKKMKFAPGRGVMRLLVLFVDGIDIWDAKEVELIDKVKTPKDLVKVNEADWAGSDKLVFVTADGCIRVTTTNSHIYSSSIHEYQMPDESFLPHLLSPKIALNMRTILSHQKWTSKAFNLNDVTNSISNQSLQEIVNHCLSCLSPEALSNLNNCPYGTAQRCLEVARLFGDESEIHFWTVALHYLKREKISVIKKTKYEDSNNAQAENMLDFLCDQPLDLCYDILCDSSTFLKSQLDRVVLHDSKRTTYEQTSKCAENLLLLGQTDRAVHLLLETEADNKNYYSDCLRACLAAAACNSETSQSTIKLVATNLIASGSVTEGVQLLCLIDKRLDACRYFQSSGRWTQAVWLAKATMCESDCSEVMKRYIDYLSLPQINQKSKALLILMSLGQFNKALEMMHSMKMFERAVLFVEACIEFDHLQPSCFQTPIIQAIYLDYARYLFNTENKEAALFYCDQVGGKKLREEFEILDKDK